MSGKAMAFPMPDGAWEIVVDTRAVASCADHETAMRLCRLIDGDYTDLPARPHALPEVQCFETAEGPVEVVVGTRAIARCANWRWAARVARLVEVDEYKRLAPWEKADIPPRPETAAQATMGGGGVR